MFLPLSQGHDGGKSRKNMIICLNEKKLKDCPNLICCSFVCFFSGGGLRPPPKLSPSFHPVSSGPSVPGAPCLPPGVEKLAKIHQCFKKVSNSIKSVQKHKYVIDLDLGLCLHFQPYVGMEEGTLARPALKKRLIKIRVKVVVHDIQMLVHVNR